MAGLDITPPGNEARTLRPWGWFETLAVGDGYRVKRLFLAPGQRLSRQRHRHRCEEWIVAAGSGRLERDGEPFDAMPGTVLAVPRGAVHRAAAAAGQALVIIEVQRGPILREDDVERLEDDYGRAAPRPA
jgi:mannose-1-phosphate guanylyltransferase/mannose-6-phosphate isomerase